MFFPNRRKFVCPFCRRVYAKSTSRILLGPGTRQCSGCSRIFADSSIEWPIAKRGDKIEYLFPVRELVYVVGGALFGAALASTARPHWRDVMVIAIWGACIAVLPLVVHLIGRMFRIQESIGRYQRHMLTKAGYSAETVGETWPK